ncbi:MAG TPA: glycoside hydrolase family 3 C-terminal domain-containing protein, partial [Acidimicrobiales bacterium]|nr:glycoside hydrolase family 3 C-terminal domain-containing protein [Acidimicrobiales bacterium]
QSQGVGASLKHFAVNNQETDRLRINALVDEKTLREIYLNAFERVIRTSAPWTVMCSYNRLNGIYASQHEWLLTEVLRGEWNFDGLVMSDWGAVDDAVSALAAGLDLEMPSSNGVGSQQVVNAIRTGQLNAAVLDVAIGRLVRLLKRSGSKTETESPFSLGEHHELAREAAGQSIVLLKNQNSILPLGDNLSRVGVVGEFARSPRFQGAGSSMVNPTRVDSALNALRERLGERAQIDFAAGFGVDDPQADDDLLLEEAVDVARRSDVVLVFLGLPASSESEGFDRVHLDLPASQLRVLEAVRVVNSRVVVVLSNGGVVETSSWEPHADAILETWLAGQASGAAVVDVLVGDVNPSARLTESIPERLADTPAFINFPGVDGEVRYGEGIFVGYRYYDVTERSVSYPFGHGLSYTTFDYRGLEVIRVDDEELPETLLEWRGPKRLRVSVTVQNVGHRAGQEVVQLYVGGVTRQREDCVRELKGFRKISLDAGASERVYFTLYQRDLSAWSLRANDWVARSGSWEVCVGASSRDLRLRLAFTLPESTSLLPLNRLSTVQE